jgi:tetratricopeptide (TPR) repeat protein
MPSIQMKADYSTKLLNTWDSETALFSIRELDMASIQRAVQLIQLHKYDLALKELDSMLADDPNIARVYSLKALAFMDKKQKLKAIENAQKAIGIDPDDAYPHYVLGVVYFNLTEDYKKTQDSIKESLKINPDNPDCYDILAQLRLIKLDYSGALKFCEEGLKLDPQDVDCLSTRARVLALMGKRGEAKQTIGNALSTDPENITALTSAGWVHLESGDHIKALEVFREVLRLNPEYDYAKAGIVQALKARIPFYRWVMGYRRWVAGLGRAKVVLIVFGIILLRAGSLLPGLGALAGLYLLYLISVLLTDPISNFILLFNKYGKYALTKKQKRQSYTAVGCLVAAMIVVVILLLFHIL